MLGPPFDADQVFFHLSADLYEMAGFIARSPMSPREREKLAIMLADHFERLAKLYGRPQLMLVHDASRRRHSN
jgi:hypothetical protein